MRDSIYLAWRYLSHHRVKTLVLVLSLSLFLGLPLVMRTMSRATQESLRSRAESTPLLLGKKGSSLDLVVEALYFRLKNVEAITEADVDAVQATGLALGIPIRTGLTARNFPLVGTSLDYFRFRGLRIAEGRELAIMGECVLGAEAAKALGLGPGDTLLTSPSTLFDLAGVYPLKLHVVGVLGPSYGPDDDAVFVDLKTAWVGEGLGHGHQDVARAGPDVVLKRQGGTVTANAKLIQYNEVTESNLDSFHFHGDRSTYPVTAVIVAPHDEKAGVIQDVKWTSEAPYTKNSTRDVTITGNMLVRELFFHWEENERVAFYVTETTVPGLTKFAEDYVVERVGPNETRLIWTVAIENTGFMRYFNPVTRVIMKPVFQAWLRKYKKLLEAR